MSILEIRTQRVKPPATVMMLGTEGVGKSTFASKFPSPIFVGAEENQELQSATFPPPKKFDDVLAQLDWLVKEKHDYKTIVIDTLDTVEILAQKKVLESDSKQTGAMNKAHGGYGAAWDMVGKEMLKVRDRLKSLKDDRDMHVVVLCHTKKRTVSDTILGTTYETVETNLHDAKVQPLFTGWVSTILFATSVLSKKEDDNSEKIFLKGDGEKIVYTERRPGFIAKNRYWMPSELPFGLDFADVFFGYYDGFYSDKKRSAEQVVENIIGLASNIPDEARKKKILDLVEQSKNDLAKLEKLESQVKTVIGG